MRNQIKTLRIPILYFLIAFAISLQSFAQNDKSIPNFDIQKIEVEGDFLNNRVNCAYQDLKGFMWFGTVNGLCRYDGNKIIEFTTTNSKLPFNDISVILGDDQGKLWLLNTFDAETKVKIVIIDIETFEIQMPERIDGQLFPQDLHISEGRNNTIYFLNKNGEILFEYKEGKLHEIKSNGKGIFGLSKPEIYRELRRISELGIKHLGGEQETNLDMFFIGMDQEEKLLIQYQEEEYAKGQYKILNQLAWVDKDGGLEKIDAEGIYSKEERIRTFYDSSTSNIWSLGRDELIITNVGRDLYYNLKEELPDIFYGDTETVSFCGNVTWVCTTIGVFKIKEKKSYFESYLARPLFDKVHHSSRSIYVNNNGDLFVTTVNDFLRVTESKIDTIIQRNHNPVIEERGDTLLTGFYGLHKFVDDKVVDSYHSPETNAIWVSLKSKTGDRYWFGHERGLGYWKEGMDSIQPFDMYNDFDELREHYVIDLKYSQNGNILVASTSGIYEFSETEGILHRYWRGGEKPYELPVNQYNYIYEDKEGVVWLGSQGGGLLKWNKVKGTYDQFTIEDGFSNNNICAIYEDNFSNLWLPSYNGLMKFNKESEHLRIYTTEDGLNHTEFNRCAHFRADDGKLYFGGLNGVNSFYPKDLEDIDSRGNSSMQLTQLYHFDGETDELVDRMDTYRKNKPVYIYSGDGYLNLEYAFLDFENNESIVYAYKIEGKHDEWQYTRNNKIECIGLAYGNYTITVKGRKNNGYFSSNELSVEFVMVKPIYLENWFIALVLIIISSFIILFFRWRNKWLVDRAKELEFKVKEQTSQLEKDKAIIEKQTIELRELDKIKSRFFANVSHELRTPITLIQGPIQSILKRGDLEDKNHEILKKLEYNTQDLMKLVNEILDLTRIEAGNLKLDESEIMFYPFIERKFNSFESIAEMKGIQFSLDCKFDKALRLSIDKAKLTKILNNLLSNAFKFTGKGGIIHFVVESTGDDMKIQIKDNGRGIPKKDIPYIFDRFYQSSKNQKAEGGLGIGLALSAEFTKLFNGKLWVESQEELGSTFFVQFPIKKLDKIDAPIHKNQISDRKIIETNPIRPRGSKSSKELILLVEDHLELQEYIQFILNDFYELKVVANGKEALDYLGEGKLPSLIISDLMMPIMDGFELLNELKKSKFYSHIPCIMLTARVDIEDKLKALRIGVDDYLTKPFNEEELIARIENLLVNYQLRKEFLKENVSKESEKEIVQLSMEDQEWLEKLENVILEKINHHSFSIDFLAEMMFINRDKLFKKTKKLTGLTPNQYVRTVRLQLAKRLLEKREGLKVKDVASKVGFQKVEYFSKLYKEQFGKSPSEYIR